MRKLIMILFLAVSSAAVCSAQETSVVFHPGDSVHVLVNFKTPPPTFEGAVFAFNLIGNPDKEQAALTPNFQGNQTKKITDTQFELTGVVPAHAASGSYRLGWISVSINNIGKQYTEGNDFKDVTIGVLNPEHPEFPAIASVHVTP